MVEIYGTRSEQRAAIEAMDIIWTYGISDDSELFLGISDK